jgi:DNA-binding protein H-NS
MTTLEKAKKELEKRRQEEKNMLKSMKEEKDKYEQYWCICGRTIKECEGLI